jgi:hypothetical protein
MYTEGIQGEFLWNAGVYLGSGANPSITIYSSYLAALFI